MMAELADEIRDLIEDRARPITFGEIAGRRLAAPAPQRPARRGFRPGRAAALAAGTVAIGCAAAITVTQLGGGPAPPKTGRTTAALLTAKTVRHIADASTAALAQSGKVRVTYRQILDRRTQQSGTDAITYSGQNFNVAIYGPTGTKLIAINRAVNGQAYLYVRGRTGRLEWYHDTGPGAMTRMSIPDPTTLLRAIEPEARLERVGDHVIGGVRLAHLRATDLRRLPNLNRSFGQYVARHEHVNSLDIWVDGRGIVHHVNITFQGTRKVWNSNIRVARHGRKLEIVTPHGTVRFSVRELHKLEASGVITSHRQIEQTTLSVTFLDIGRPQTITVPAHAIPIVGKG